MEAIPDPELTAIYARKSMKGDKQEITVNRQKRLALDDCEKLGLTVNRENIFVDNGEEYDFPKHIGYRFRVTYPQQAQIAPNGAG